MRKIKYHLHLVLLLAVSTLFSCRHQKDIPADNLVYLQIGDSITYGEKNSAGNSPGAYAVRALATPATYIKLGWSGESAHEFNQKRRQQLQDSLAAIPPGHRLILGIAYGANDLNSSPKEKVLRDILRIADWATDTLQVKEVLLIPVMNRTDKWGFTREADMSKSQHFNTSRLWLNAQLRAALRKRARLRMAQETDSQAMFRDEAPADTTRFADAVHPKDKGAEELGSVIAHGIASFGNVQLK